MASQSVTQLTQQTTTDTTSILYAAGAGGTTDTGLPLSVLLASPTFTGTVTIPTSTVTGVMTSSNSTDSTATNVGSFRLAGGMGIAKSIYCGGSFNGAIGNGTPNTGAFTTLSTSGLYSPSSTVGIKGTIAVDNAQAGSWGEYTTNSATATSLTSGTSANAVSISLTAGDWDLVGTITVVPAGSTTVSISTGGISTTSATLPAGNTGASFQIIVPSVAGAAVINSTGVVRVSISATTTVYLVSNVTFAVSTCTVNGFIRARRVR